MGIGDRRPQTRSSRHIAREIFESGEREGGREREREEKRGRERERERTRWEIPGKFESVQQ